MDEPALCRALASEPLLEFLGLLGLLQICGCRKNALPPEARQYLLFKLGYWDLAPAPRGEPAHWIRQLVAYLAKRLRKAANSHAPPKLLHSSRFVPFPVELDVVLHELLYTLFTFRTVPCRATCSDHSPRHTTDHLLPFSSLTV